MAEIDPKRLQEIVTALMTRRLEASLAEVERALASWRGGESEMLEAHAEAMRHAARAGALSARVARAGLEGAEELLRDALDAGVIEVEEFRALTGKEPADVPLPPPLEEAARTTPTMPPKKTVMSKLLEDGPVLVHLDPRGDDVDVPPAFSDQPQLVLRFGYGLSPPIQDLEVGDEHLVGTLTFRGMPYHCVVPWHAIFALVAEDGRGLVWPEDVPAEVRQEYLDKKEGGEKPDPEPPKPKRGGHLKLVT